MSTHSTLITDFDNTLYDWFDMWHRSFSAMLSEIERISGLDRRVLLPEIRAIHQRNRTSEYAFLIEEIPSLRKAFPGENILQLFDEAIHAYRKARRDSLRLYDGVRDTLVDLRSRGITIVIYTESLGYYTNYRIRRLELDELVDFVYSPPDHAIPENLKPTLSPDSARLSHATHRFLPEGVVKPNPEVLLDIVSEIGRSPGECLYLGDSLMKDVAMAQGAKILDVLASYGAVQQREEYNILRAVSHWTEEDVRRERETSPKDVTPTYTIRSFTEIRSFF